MPSDSSDCHLCHLHDHNAPNSLLKTTTLRHHSPSPTRLHHHHHHRHHGSHHHRHHPRSRSGSIDNTYRDHHVHHHRISRMPSNLARLTDHSVAQSLPASRSNTLRLYPEQVSVLPGGGRRYLGGDRSSVHSMEMGGSHHSLIKGETLRKSSLTLNPDNLTGNIPPLRAHGSQMSLSGQSLAPSQATPADYFMNRIPFKDKGRRRRFTLQTVCLIGCYALLFMMAIVIGVVLSYQNGWLGFGTSDSLRGDKDSTGPTVTFLESDRNGSGGRELSRIQDARSTINQPPVHNNVQIRNQAPPRTNIAGIINGQQGEGRPRSISSGTDIRVLPGNRPVNNIPNTAIRPNNDPFFENLPSINNVGVPLPTLNNNSSREIPVPFLMSTGPHLTSTQGTRVRANPGRIIINAPPIQQINPFIVPQSNNQNQNIRQGINTQNIGQGINTQNVGQGINTQNIGQGINTQNIRQGINTQNIGVPLPVFPSNGQNTAFSFPPEQGRPRPNIPIKVNERVELNEIQMEKMKMLKEILDSEGTGKLLQDLITLKNNRNSMSAISKHLSEVAVHEENVAKAHKPKLQEKTKIVPAVLQHKNTESPLPKPQFPPPFKTGSVEKDSIQITTTQKPKTNNIQMVRELLSSLINSPEVQEILASRKKQKSGATNLGDITEQDGRIKVQGDEMREVLLNALAKEIPSGHSLQRLRLHGPQPAQSRQPSFSNKVPPRREHKTSLTRPSITPAHQLVHFNTSTPARTVSTRKAIDPNRVFRNRMGRSRKLTEQSKPKPKIRNRTTPRPIRRKPKTKPMFGATSRGRQLPSPNYRLQVKTEGNQNPARDDSWKRHFTAESININHGSKKNTPFGQVVRHWQTMDNDGTVSLGHVRGDGSFSFTNCRPVEMCAKNR